MPLCIRVVKTIIFAALLISGTNYLAAAAPYGNGSDGTLLVEDSRNINTDSLGASSDRNGAWADGIAYRVMTNPTSTQINIGQTANGFMPGDKALLINLQGAANDYTDVGQYEVLNVVNVYGNNIYVERTPLKSYAGNNFANQKVIIQRIPQYRTVTVASSGTITASAWDGLTAAPSGHAGYATGIVAFCVSDQVDVYGIIHASQLGFRGGVFDGYNSLGGEAYSGKGGGNANRALLEDGVCGGGSGRYVELGAGNGGAGSSVGGGGGAFGGGAGYGSEGQGGSGHGTPGFPGVGSHSGNGGGSSGSGDDIGGGGGGGTYGVPSLQNIFLGSGGGAGSGPFAGNGGGILLLLANTFNILGGRVSADGGDGGGGMYWITGGAGTGGSIKLSAVTLSLGTDQVTAQGGIGGRGYFVSDGGNGGHGRIAMIYTQSGGSTTPTAYAGMPLVAPDSLTATSGSNLDVALAWANHSIFQNGCVIERSFSANGSWTSIQHVGAGVSTFTDTNLNVATTYYYRVKAFSDAQLVESPYSNTVSATTPATVPTSTPTIAVTPTLSPTATAYNPWTTVDLTGKLFLACPNPAKEKVTFIIHTQRVAEFKIIVYNLAGERISESWAHLGSGPGQTAEWECSKIPSGIYIAKLLLDGKLLATQKIAIAR